MKPRPILPRPLLVLLHSLAPNPCAGSACVGAPAPFPALFAIPAVAGRGPSQDPLTFPAVAVGARAIAALACYVRACPATGRTR